MSRRALARLGLATVAVVLGTIGLTAPAHAADEYGGIAGRLTTADGAPLADAGVTAWTAEDWSQLAQTSTGPDGAFELPHLPPGGVKLEFHANDLTQWAHRQRSYDDATVLEVTAGKVVTADERLFPTATLTGLLRDAAGGPAAGITVTATGVKHGDTYYAGTGPDGRWTMTTLPGTYTVNFDQTVSRQWAHRAVTEAAATTFELAAGQTVTVDEQLLPTGSLSGRFTTAAGRGRPDTRVSVYRDGEYQTTGYTDENGRWSLPGALPGAYKVQFSDMSDDETIQWARGKPSEETADPVIVVAGKDTVVDDSVVPRGTVRGRLTDADGGPLARWHVSVHTPGDDAGNGAWYDGRTDAKGRFRITGVLPGRYVVRFSAASDGGRHQYAYGKVTEAEATVIEVGRGATVTVNDTMLPPAQVTVSAVDAKTRTPVKNFCVFLSGPQSAERCTKGSKVTLGGLTAGAYQGDVRPRGSLYQRAEFEFTVAAGRKVTRTAKLALGGAIRTTAADRAGGTAVADACIVAVTPRSGGIGDGGGDCTNAAGSVRSTVLAPGVYNVFVYGPSTWDEENETTIPVYGHQWLGRTGGTGDQRLAAQVTVKAGKVAKAPAILLDRPGVLTGKVTDKATGRPLVDADVSFQAWHFQVGPSGSVDTDAEGRYRLDDLGPYAWPLAVTAQGFPRQWSGGTGNRFKATTATVVPGRTTTFDLSVKKSPAALAGRVTWASGRLGSGFVTAFNAATGDPVATHWFEADGAFTLAVPPGEPVKLGYDFRGADGRDVYGFHAGAAVLDRAKVVAVPKSGTRTVNITVK